MQGALLDEVDEALQDDVSRDFLLDGGNELPIEKFGIVVLTYAAIMG